LRPHKIDNYRNNKSGQKSDDPFLVNNVLKDFMVKDKIKHVLKGCDHIVNEIVLQYDSIPFKRPYQGFNGKNEPQHN
jgi:hypothetical protein